MFLKKLEIAKKQKENLIIYSTILILILIIISYFKWKVKKIALFLVSLVSWFLFSPKKKYRKKNPCVNERKKNSKASRTWRNACLIYFLCFSILILNNKKKQKKERKKNTEIFNIFNKHKPPPHFTPYTLLTKKKTRY